ncbi:hypothetical protein [Isoptericola aurantiacus]|uniref:hypothetical protein n=1 Tax=Isoptericola aurantiacus TaxID=3377839 RepID=UPI00383AC188
MTPREIAAETSTWAWAAGAVAFVVGMEIAAGIISMARGLRDQGIDPWSAFDRGCDEGEEA